jgi:hypothetical protein
VEQQLNRAGLPKANQKSNPANPNPKAIRTVPRKIDLYIGCSEFEYQGDLTTMHPIGETRSMCISLELVELQFR